MAAAKKSPALLKPGHTFCPGCGHGTFIRILHEVFEEKGLSQNNVCLIGVGCSATYNFTLDGGNCVECQHGRSPSTARGMKAVAPEICTWTYQGDGDAYSIGMGETIQAAHCSFPISTFVINNCNYGMTGGQTAMTTLHGQVTTTAAHGNQGHPFDIMPHMQAEKFVGYAARGTTVTVAECNKLKKYIGNAIDAQMKYHIYGMVEILSPCPTNWHKSPLDAADWLMTEAVKDFPLGEFVNRLSDKEV